MVPFNRFRMKVGIARISSLIRPATQFVCVQSIVVDDTDALWVVDPAAPLFGQRRAGRSEADQDRLKRNDVTRVISFDPAVAKADT